MRTCLCVVVVLILVLNLSALHLTHRRKALLPRIAQPGNTNVLPSISVRGGATKYKRSGIVSYFRSFMDKLRTYLTKSTKKKTVSKASNRNDKDASIVRIQKEMQEFIDNPPANCKLALVSKSNIRKWDVTLTGCEGTIYAGEQYKLRIEFSKQYPAKAPSVYFLKPTPKHVHVYSNGDICLNILGKDWRPTMTAQTIVVSILSMLSSAKAKGMPLDNASHSDMEPGKTNDYLYHDEKC